MTVGFFFSYPENPVNPVKKIFDKIYRIARIGNNDLPPILKIL